jgi:membrane protein DedA with SNARE-associated domain
MNLESIIAIYGYPALFAGILLEGETVLIIAGFLAHRGYLHLSLVMIVAFLGAYLYGQAFFYLGKRGKGAFLERMPRFQPGLLKVNRLLDAYQTLIVIGFRFLYGMRTVTPLVIGISGYSSRRFALLNAIGSFFWALAIASIGFLFGQVLDAMLSDIRRYELWVLFGIAFAGAAVWIIRSRRARISEMAKSNTVQ